LGKGGRAEKKGSAPLGRPLFLGFMWVGGENNLEYQICSAFPVSLRKIEHHICQKLQEVDQVAFWCRPHCAGALI